MNITKKFKRESTDENSFYTGASNKFNILRSCTSKKQLVSQAQAEEIIKIMEEKGNKNLHAYNCSICRMIHIGHNRKVKEE